MPSLEALEFNLTRELPENFDQMVSAMLTCNQTQGQTIYQHGMSVWGHMVDLVTYVKSQQSILNNWRLPSWIDEYRQQIQANLHEDQIIHLYTIFHDCGKPYCLVTEDGKNHFPNHAKVSEYIWCLVSGDSTVGRLIANDMMIHNASAEEISEKLEKELSISDSMTLLLAALAEIHSNAEMFGSLDSVNFKMKWKTVERRGRQILKFWFGDHSRNRGAQV